MNKSIPTYLRLLSDVAAESSAPPDEDLARWLDCCEAFHDCTGWRLEFASGAPKQDAHSMWSAPVAPGVGKSLGHIRIVSRDGDDPSRRNSLAQSKLLAAAVGGMWGDVLVTREALRRREAELAAGVPVSARSDEAGHLAERLEAVLGAGAEATGCQAAALYLLDEGTSELKLRASWGMPRCSLVEPARPLRGAAADLEALLGHAVVVTDPRLFGYWKVPRACAAAACVPVASPTNPLGTLWVFANDPRDFSSVETNLLEVIAGRLAADLEREMLLAELERMRLRGPLFPGAAQASTALPQGVSLDHWEVGGWRSPQAGEGRAWIDWFAVASDHMAFVAGRSDGPSAIAAEAATRAAARAASNWDTGPAEAIGRVNAALWALDEGAAGASLAYAKLDTHHGLLTAALTGDVGLAFFTAPARGTSGQAKGHEPLSARVFPPEPGALGSREAAFPRDQTLKFKSGDSLVAWAGPPMDAASEIPQVVAATFREQPGGSAADQAAMIGDKLAASCLPSRYSDARTSDAWATFVLRRR